MVLWGVSGRVEGHDRPPRSDLARQFLHIQQLLMDGLDKHLGKGGPEHSSIPKGFS